MNAAKPLMMSRTTFVECSRMS